MTSCRNRVEKDGQVYFRLAEGTRILKTDFYDYKCKCKCCYEEDAYDFCEVNWQEDTDGFVTGDNYWRTLNPAPHRYKSPVDVSKAFASGFDTMDGEAYPDKDLCNIRDCQSEIRWDAHSLGFLCDVHAKSMLKEKRFIVEAGKPIASELIALGRKVKDLKSQLKIMTEDRDEYQRKLRNSEHCDTCGVLIKEGESTQFKKNPKTARKVLCHPGELCGCGR